MVLIRSLLYFKNLFHFFWPLWFQMRNLLSFKLWFSYKKFAIFLFLLSRFWFVLHFQKFIIIISLGIDSLGLSYLGLLSFLSIYFYISLQIWKASSHYFWMFLQSLLCLSSWNSDDCDYRLIFYCSTGTWDSSPPPPPQSIICLLFRPNILYLYVFKFIDSVLYFYFTIVPNHWIYHFY